VLDPSIESLDALLPRLAAADEIVAACRYADQQSLAAGFIKVNATVKDVRTKLFAMAADADEATVIDTSPKTKALAQPKPKAAFTTRDAYKSLNQFTKG
jgi:methylmalonyl-CoA mutase N-terminal domain/subunit